MFCNRCNKQMKYVMRFENGKAFEFHRCPNCWAESKKRVIYFLDEQKRQNQLRKHKLNKSTRKKGKKVRNDQNKQKSACVYRNGR